MHAADRERKLTRLRTKDFFIVKRVEALWARREVHGVRSSGLPGAETVEAVLEQPSNPHERHGCLGKRRFGEDTVNSWLTTHTHTSQAEQRSSRSTKR